MDYSKSYLSSVSLANMIRENAYFGKKYKPSGGLAERIKAAKESAPNTSFENLRASYMRDIQDMFSSLSTKANDPANVDLSYNLPSPDTLPVKAEDYTLGRPETFVDKLTQSESSGNPYAIHVTKDGRTYGGLLQIGQARLDDYNKATGSNVEMADMMQSPSIQEQVNKWHIADLTSLAESLSAKNGMSVNGLVAVGHLGGRKGMVRFAQGNYNPSDELGTSLTDYYTRFK